MDTLKWTDIERSIIALLFAFLLGWTLQLRTFLDLVLHVYKPMVILALKHKAEMGLLQAFVIDIR